METNTVSNKIFSSEKANLALLSVINSSFLQEVITIIMETKMKERSLEYLCMMELTNIEMKPCFKLFLQSTIAGSE